MLHRRLVSVASVQLLSAAMAVFAALALLFYAVYGRVFLEASYFYHLSRTDTKHNFSVYFYPMQLHEVAPARFPDVAWLASPLQLIVVAVLGWAYAACPARAMLLQTLAFVALNRVITAQYFVWWLSLLPVALPWLRVDVHLARALVLWAAAEVHWLLWAYLLEFRHWHVAPFVWIASGLFLAAEARVAWVLQRGRGAGN
eukprot:NODE_22233_length_716_cov_7.480475.p1 GENE.NODE_22233_length_716_cov_7.480475~~NODE_22233_length_716_cov_7.480475.p1  ORF type:complete len:211 (+),score=51.44 NODE_22233_length_716_cov_7.480475:35-634(+)